MIWLNPKYEPMPHMTPMVVALRVYNEELGSEWVEQFACFLHDEDGILLDLADRDPLPWIPESIERFCVLPPLAITD